MSRKGKTSIPPSQIPHSVTQYPGLKTIGSSAGCSLQCLHRATNSSSCGGRGLASRTQKCSVQYEMQFRFYWFEEPSLPNCSGRVYATFTQSTDRFLPWEISPWMQIFGSGTRLYVTNEAVLKPTVSVYTASPDALTGRRALLCLAADMFPDVVQVSWRRESPRGQMEEVPFTERMEMTEPGRTTGLILLDQQQAIYFIFSMALMTRLKESVPDVPVVTTVVPVTTSLPQPASVDNTDLFQMLCTVKLASLVYSLMVMKFFMFSCGLLLLRRPSSP